MPYIEKAQFKHDAKNRVMRVRWDDYIVHMKYNVINDDLHVHHFRYRNVAPVKLNLYYTDVPDKYEVELHVRTQDELWRGENWEDLGSRFVVSETAKEWHNYEHFIAHYNNPEDPFTPVRILQEFLEDLDEPLLHKHSKIFISHWIDEYPFYLRKDVLDVDRHYSSPNCMIDPNDWQNVVKLNYNWETDDVDMSKDVIPKDGKEHWILMQWAYDDPVSYEKRYDREGYKCFDSQWVIEGIMIRAGYTTDGKVYIASVPPKIVQFVMWDLDSYEYTFPVFNMINLGSGLNSRGHIMLEKITAKLFKEAKYSY